MGIENKKSEGGKKLDQEAIRSIAVAVKGLIDQDEEKGKTSEELGEIRSEVGELKGQLAQVQKALYCTEDGKICFNTPEELSAFMEKQETALKEVDGKVSTVIERIKGIEATRKEEAEKLPRKPTKKWDDMTPEERTATVHDLDSLGFPHSAHYEVMKGCSDNPAEEGKEKCNILGKTLKDYPVEEIFEQLPEEKRGKAVLLGCESGNCRVQLGDKIRIYKQDPKGRWKWIDEPPEDKGSHF